MTGRDLLARPDGPQIFKKMDLPLRILHLPGHTADSIGLLNEEDGVLYCGDAAMNAVISPKRHTIWIDDAAQFQKSWDVMLAANPTRIVPSHGNPFSPRIWQSIVIIWMTVS